MNNTLHKNHIEQFRQDLLNWFDREFRDLPWRRERDPYAIWVSEIMLQQTQVATVVPYFQRFMQAFPTINALAGADQEQVLKLWEGLGYYARARNLHRAAKQIMERHGGIFPHDPQAVRDLSGIGPYTAAAILSIAFDHEYAVVDGNVNRVLCRLHRIETDPKSTAGKKVMAALAQELLPKERPGDHNQAMMELGALICRPRNPQCPQCPVARFCGAYQQDNPEQYPVKAPTKTTPHHHIAAGIIYRDDNRILIAKRPENGLLGGLWEFPGGKVEPGESHEQATAREIREELDIEVVVKELYESVRHAYSHFSITLHVYNCEYISGNPKSLGCADWKWVSLGEIDHYAFPRANRKILDKLLSKEG